MNSGDLTKIDMMIEDIYGKNTANLGLPADLIASSLGKIGKMSKEELAEQKDEDISRALITAFAINTANLARNFLNQHSIANLMILADQFHNDKFYYLVQVILL